MPYKQQILIQHSSGGGKYKIDPFLKEWKHQHSWEKETCSGIQASGSFGRKPSKGQYLQIHLRVGVGGRIKYCLQLYLFLIVAVTNDRKLSGLKQYKFIILHFWRSKILKWR